jgi:hypothetical protein
VVARDEGGRRGQAAGRICRGVRDWRRRSGVKGKRPTPGLPCMFRTRRGELGAGRRGGEECGVGESKQLHGTGQAGGS